MPSSRSFHLPLISSDLWAVISILEFWQGGNAWAGLSDISNHNQPRFPEWNNLIQFNNNNSNNYEFIDFVIAHKICETFECAFVELMKYCMTKNYDERTSFFITHVIYFRMKIDFHIENLVALIITFLINHSIILERFWIIKIISSSTLRPSNMTKK